ncbi:MAG TPA: MotA/TolQ/ExbB proton channel family protein [Candidatus Krumholzibacteria bacterium]|nr:MotA/TolQ/ExbB proton channel family protein [Candidatus Krumholzibacteria bacterium]
MDALGPLASFFEGGGPFMFVILGCAVLIVAIVLERTWVIGRAGAMNRTRFVRDVTRMVAKGDVAAATELCRKVQNPSGRVAYAILSSGTQDEDKLNNAADGAAVVVLPALGKRLPLLSMLANVATLLGLLGTIFGLTTAFSAVGAADPAQRSAFLASGISQALNTTAFGLMVAVPAMVIHGLLVGKVEGIVEQVDEVSVKLVRALTGRPSTI